MLKVKFLKMKKKLKQNNLTRITPSNSAILYKLFILLQVFKKNIYLHKNMTKILLGLFFYEE